MDPQEHPTKDLKKPNSLSPFSGGRSVVEKSFLGKQVPLQNRKIIKLACLLTNLVKTLQKTTHGSRSSSLSFARNISCLHFEPASVGAAPTCGRIPYTGGRLKFLRTTIQLFI